MITAILLVISVVLNLYFYHIKVKKNETTKLCLLNAVVKAHLHHMSKMLRKEYQSLPDLYIDLENRLTSLR